MQEIRIESPQLFGFAGAALLFLGCFLPLVHLPIVGSINYVFNGRGDGMFVVGLALASGFLVYKKMYTALWLSGGLIAAICGYTLYQFQSAISGVRNSMDTDLKDNPFRGLADVLVSSVGLDWGWAVLAIGLGSLFLCAAIGSKTEGERNGNFA